MTEPDSIMRPSNAMPKTVTISAELAEAYVSLYREAEHQVRVYEEDMIAMLERAVDAVREASVVTQCDVADMEEKA